MTPHPDPHLALLDDARHAEAVADRAHRRLLTEADDTDATFLGTLAVLAEGGSTVVLETTVGRRVRGRVTAVTAHHVRVRAEHGDVWVRVSAVSVLRAGPRVRLRAGDAAHRPADQPLAAALGPVVEHRGHVEVLLDGGPVVRGPAVAVGRDVLTVRNPATGDHSLVALDRAAVVVVHPH